ncbi:MAG: hypothetical protein E6G61_06620 [Actinobacteria bacterium]|nr:MAG: hypothetical protein E6G61_06620 [Actinomycetota bacterium]
MLADLGMELERPAVVRRIGDQQDQAVRTKVPPFQRSLPRDCLDIGEARFRLHEDRAESALYRRVTCSKISSDRHRHLRAPSKTGVQTAPEAIEQRELRPVSDGIAIEMEGCGELEAHGRGDPSGQIDRERALLAALCTLDPMWAHPDNASDLANAQPAGDASSAEITANAVAKESTSGRSQRSDAFSARHGSTIGTAPHPALIPP